MKRFSSLLAAAFSLAVGSELVAQEAATFENFLLRSPSIVSPSQNYQVKPTGRFEAYLGAIDGTVDPKAAGIGDFDISGAEFAVGGYFSPNNLLVVGVDVDYISTEVDRLDGTRTEVTPSISFAATPILSVGVAAHVVNGTQDAAAPAADVDSDYTTFSLGATLHMDQWEGTLHFSSENKEDDKPQDNAAETWGIHGRYRLNPALALGVSLFQSDTSGLAAANSKAEDETGFGLHVESTFTNEFGMEFAFLSTADVDGASGSDQSEFQAMGLYRVTPKVEIGGRISYVTTAGNASDSTIFAPGLILSASF